MQPHYNTEPAISGLLGK